MDLFVGIHKAGGTIGIRATCGIHRECRCVQHRNQHAQQHNRGEGIEKAHGMVFRVRRSPNGTANLNLPDDFRMCRPRTSLAHWRRLGRCDFATPRRNFVGWPFVMNVGPVTGRDLPKKVLNRKRDLFRGAPGSAQPRHSRGNHNEQVLTRICRCHVGGSFPVSGAACRSALLGLCCRPRRRCRSCRRRCRRQCHSQYLRPGLRCAARLRGLPELCSRGASGMPRRLLGASTSGI